MTIEDVKKIEGVRVEEHLISGYRVYAVIGSLWELRKKLGNVIKSIPTIVALGETDVSAETPLVILPVESCELFDEQMIAFTVHRELWFYLNRDYGGGRITQENQADLYAIQHTGAKADIIVKILAALETAMDKNYGNLFRLVMMWREKRRVYKRAHKLIDQGVYELKRAK